MRSRVSSRDARMRSTLVAADCAEVPDLSLTPCTSLRNPCGSGPRISGTTSSERAASRERGDECGPLAWRHEIAHPITQRRNRHPGDIVIADALLTYTQQRSDRTLRVHQRFIELDRATIPLQALCEKFDRYARLRDYTPEEPGREARRSGWRAYYDQFPGVLVIFAHRDRKTLQRRMQNMIALHQADVQTPGLTVLTGLLEDLCEHGPFAPIFIDPQNPEHYLDWLGKPQPENHQ